MDLPHSHRISRVLCYSGYRSVFFDFDYVTITLFCLPFKVSSSIVKQSYMRSSPVQGYPRKCGLFRVRSPLLTESFVYFLFLYLLRCFGSVGSLHCNYEFIAGYLGITLSEFPHSAIHGSQVTYTYPWLIAVNHGLHRRQLPRHPLYALNSLILLILYMFLDS